MVARKEILERLGFFFDTLYSDRAAEEECYKFMKEKNVNRGRFNAYVFRMEELSKMSDEEIFWFASYPKTKINLPDYFSEQETKKYSVSKVNLKKTIYPVVFDNVLPISDDQFVTTISTKKLHELYSNSILAYNIRTQRAPKVYYKNGKEAYKINVNRHSVKEIRDLIERGLFISNDLSFNVGDRDENDYYYDEQNAKFVLKSGLCDILDGFHRIMGIIQVMTEDPDFEKEFVLNIMAFPEAKAKRFVAQQDKRNKIASSFSKSLDDTRYDSIVTKKLNENSESLLFGQIRTMGRHNIDYGRTAETVKFFFSPKSISDVNETERRIVEGLAQIYKKGLPKDIDDIEIRIALAYIKLANPPYSLKKLSMIKALLEEESDGRFTLGQVKRATKEIIGANQDELV